MSSKDALVVTVVVDADATVVSICIDFDCGEVSSIPVSCADDPG